MTWLVWYALLSVVMASGMLMVIRDDHDLQHIGFGSWTFAFLMMLLIWPVFVVARIMR